MAPEGVLTVLDSAGSVPLLTGPNSTERMLLLTHLNPTLAMLLSMYRIPFLTGFLAAPDLTQSVLHPSESTASLAPDPISRSVNVG